MINPEIRKEYGENGEKIMKEFCETLTERERNSIYAIDHYTLSAIQGIPFELASDIPDLVDDISERITEHIFTIDPNAVVMCVKYEGEGIKVCLSTQ